MRSGRYARARMEAAISCKFHCKRLEARWRGYWPGVDAADLVADVEGRLTSAAAAWGLKDIEPLDGGQVALTCGATQNGRPVVLKLNPRDHPTTLSSPRRATPWRSGAPPAPRRSSSTSATAASRTCWSASNPVIRSRRPISAPRGTTRGDRAAG